MKKFLLLIVMLLIAGCGSEVSTPPLVRVEEATPNPTKGPIKRTATPSPTPIFTSTPAPTATEVPCSIQSLEFLSEIETIAERWEDAVDLTSITARISVAGPIATLQEIKQDANKLNAPACSEMIAEQLTLYMESTIDAFLGFAANDSDDIVAKQLAHASFMSQLFEDYLSSVDGLANVEPRFFLYAHGPGKTMRVSYEAGEEASYSFTIADEWLYQVDDDPEFPLALDVTTYSGSTFNAHVCSIYQEGTLLTSISSYSFRDRVSCSINAP